MEASDGDVYGDIYRPKTLWSDYGSLMAHLNGINGQLKKDGIAMPSSDSMDTVRRLYDNLGRPLDVIKTVHVGGTNGKGTTSWKIAAACRSQGLTTGLFVSPHISSFRERFQINGRLVSEADFMKVVPRVLECCASCKIPATLFELTFGIACLVFELAACDVVVLEVGVGGLLDATNVVQTALSIICSVSLDHTRILGNTVEEIAAVKSGIFKPGVPALVGKYTPVAQLRDKAALVGAPFYFVGDMVDAALFSADEDGCPLNADQDCACIARAALILLGAQQGLAAAIDMKSTALLDAIDTSPPCRWEVHEVKGNEGDCVRVVLDVGHNPAAVAAMSRKARRQFPDAEVYVMFAASRGRDLVPCLRCVGEMATQPGLVAFAECQYFRAVSVEDLRAMFAEQMGTSSGCVTRTADATGDDGPREYELVDRAHVDEAEVIRGVTPVFRTLMHRARAAVNNAVVVVCGSLYMMSDVRRELGIDEPRDDL